MEAVFRAAYATVAFNISHIGVEAASWINSAELIDAKAHRRDSIAQEQVKAPMWGRRPFGIT
jgi:hypothetical protein